MRVKKTKNYKHKDDWDYIGQEFGLRAEREGTTALWTVFTILSIPSLLSAGVVRVRACKHRLYRHLAVRIVIATVIRVSSTFFKTPPLGLVCSVFVRLTEIHHILGAKFSTLPRKKDRRHRKNLLLFRKLRKVSFE